MENKGCTLCAMAGMETTGVLEVIPPDGWLGNLWRPGQTVWLCEACAAQVAESEPASESDREMRARVRVWVSDFLRANGIVTEMRTYSVRLTPAQRAQLEALGRGGSMGSGVRRLLRIWAVLQQAAQDQPDLPISLVVTLAAKTD